MVKLTDCGFNLTGWKMRDQALISALKSWCVRVADAGGRHVLMPLPNWGGSLILGLGDDSHDVKYLSVSETVRAGGFDVMGLKLSDIQTPSADLVCSAIEDVMKRGTPSYTWVDFQNFGGQEARYELLILPIGDLRRPRSVMMLEAMDGFIQQEIPEFLQAKIVRPDGTPLAAE